MKCSHFKQLLPLLLVLLIFSCKKEEEEDICEILPETCHIYPEISCDQVLEEKQDIITELPDYIYSIEDSDPTRDFVDLTALGAYLNDADFVGLGEATHGTLEFFQMKDRVFRYLVEELGFKAIGFEATWGGALHVNEYIVNDIGTAEEAIGKMQFWTWYTEEVLTLVEWMHDYNLDKADEDKIFFYGFDLQSGTEERYWLNKYLGEHLPSIQTDIINKIDAFMDVADYYTYSNLPFATRNELIEGINDARQIFENNQETLVNNSAQKKYDLMLYAFDILLQFEEILSNTGNSRDFYMAQNSVWIKDYIGNDAKIALWAHNGHVSKETQYFTPQGEYLYNTFGNQYKNVGFSFSSGYFQAISETGLTDNFLASPTCNSVNKVFSQQETDNFYIIFDDIENNSSTSDYFNTYQPFSVIGATFYQERNYFPVGPPLQKAFDIMIHFETTTAAKSL